MEAAVAADSTFAMAAYWVVKILAWRDPPRSSPYLELARRMAVHAAPAERRLIDLHGAMEDPRGQPLAELLASQYPNDPDILVIASQATLRAGAYPRSMELARRAIELDTARPPPGGPCASCDAYVTLVGALFALDSQPTLERTVRTWRSTRPDDIRAEGFMAATFEFQGRYQESHAILQQMVDRGRGSVDLPYNAISMAIRRGEIEEAGAIIDSTEKAIPDSLLGDVVWSRVALLRQTGRLVEARRLVRRRHALDPETWSVQAAQIAFESGNFSEAFGLGRQYINRPWPVPGDTTLNAGRLPWWLTRGSTYLAAAGDTATLRQVASRLRQVGQLSPSGRDQRAYHYPLGLLARAGGRMAEAEAELRAAVLAPSDGYIRINIELAQLLEQQGRPRDAIPILRSAMHSDRISGSTLFVTQTELHEALGRVYAGLGEVDSARVHYDYVARVWAHADPNFLPRLEAARAYLMKHRDRAP